MKCTVLECFSKAVAYAGEEEEKNRYYCAECAIKVTKLCGPGHLKELPGALFPWNAPIIGKCPHCNTHYSRYLIGLTGDCPNCRIDLPEEVLNPPGEEFDEE